MAIFLNLAFSAVKNGGPPGAAFPHSAFCVQMRVTPWLIRPPLASLSPCVGEDE